MRMKCTSEEEGMKQGKEDKQKGGGGMDGTGISAVRFNFISAYSFLRIINRTLHRVH
jgi:hypothetical protein